MLFLPHSRNKTLRQNHLDKQFKMNDYSFNIAIAYEKYR